MTQEDTNPAPASTPSDELVSDKPKRKSRKQSGQTSDIFDEQAALREQERQSTAQPESAEPSKQEDGSHVERLKFPEPFGIQTVALTADKDGTKMFLSRSSRFRQMRIAFDEKPGEASLQLLRDNGFRWNIQHKAWTLQLERGAEWRGHADAEKLFRDIANSIREQNGLEPIGQTMAAGM